MASVKQLENWLDRTHERVDKFKALLKEETTRKKEMVRPKSPEQVKQKETIIRTISRYRDELTHSKARKKDLEVQLKEAKRTQIHPSKKAVKSVEKALSRKFNQKTQVTKTTRPKGKAGDNRILLPEVKSPKRQLGVDERLQAMEGRLYGLEQDLKDLVELVKSGNAQLLEAFGSKGR